MHRKVYLCTAAGLLALAMACGKSSEAPTSPSSATTPDSSANADGSNLKATAPSIVSPSGGTQATDPLTFTAGKASAKLTDVPLSYQFQVRSGSTVVYDSGTVGGVGAGNNVTFSAGASNTQPDREYPWRSRAGLGSPRGPWSRDGTCQSPRRSFM